MPTGIVVIVSAFFALIGTIISKENKVSEFRQKWIDELREEIGVVIANCIAIQSLSSDTAYVLNEIFSNENPDEKEKYRRDQNKDIRELYLNLNKAATSIRLRVNETEFSNQLDLLMLSSSKFQGYIYQIYQQNTNVPNVLNSAEGQNFVFEMNKFTELSKKLLKSEWERVKKGEKVFYNTVQGMKYVLITVTLIITMSSLISGLLGEELFRFLTLYHNQTTQ